MNRKRNRTERGGRRQNRVAKLARGVGHKLAGPPKCGVGEPAHGLGELGGGNREQHEVGLCKQLRHRRDGNVW